jgi:choline dehydrogenase-like flavoprotein
LPGALPRHLSCTGLRGGATGSGGSAAAEVAAPAGRDVFIAVERGGAQIALRRLSASFPDAPFARLTAPARGELILPRDDSALPWQVKVQTTGTGGRAGRVCVT